MTDYDRIITIDVESGGKISGIGLATGNYLEAGLHDDGKILIVYMLEHNFPEEACKNFDYFITNYWYSLDTLEFVKVKSERPNDYAYYVIATESWSWPAELVLADIRRRRNSLLTRSDWTQLSDTNLSAEQKAAAVDYRRALRDLTNTLPENPVNVDAIDWPTVPDFLQ